MDNKEWDNFVSFKIKTPTKSKILRISNENNIDHKQVRTLFKYIKKTTKMYKNNIYTVGIQDLFIHNMPHKHLIIKRNDKKPISWVTDVQKIIDILVGNEFEAVVYFPKLRKRYENYNIIHAWVCNDKNYEAPYVIEDPV